MSVRQAAVSVLDCDAPDCTRLATPTVLRQEKPAGARRAIRVGWNIDAFKAAGDAGWVQEARVLGEWATYCPDHADVPERPEPIRGARTEPARTVPVHRRPESTIVDAPLPDMPAT